MSLPYKLKEEQTLTCDIGFKDGGMWFQFESDCGKFGTHETLAEFKLTPYRLLQILSEREDIEDHEL